MKKIVFFMFAISFMSISCNNTIKEPQSNICGVKDPLQDIEWLREYCESINETQDFSSVYIYLYKVINTDEHLFQICISYLEETNYPFPYSECWKNCDGDIVFNTHSEVPPNTDMVKEFLKDKELISELFHFENNKCQWREKIIFDYELPEGASQPSDIEITYTSRGDTLINGIMRDKLYFSKVGEHDEILIGFFHTENNKMYFRAKEGINFRDYYLLLCEGNYNTDVLLYDFSITENDIIQNCSGDYTVSGINMLTIGQYEWKKYSLSMTNPPYATTYWIENIGSILGLFYPISAQVVDMYYKRLITYSENGILLWSNSN
jgi:hypothetical protein